MPIGYYDEGISIDRAMRAQAVQRFMMSSSSGSPLNLAPNLSVNLLSRSHGMGRASMGEIKSWADHIGSITPFSIRLLGLNASDRFAVWTEYDATQRQSVYIDMMKQKVTGQGDLDANTMAFIINELKNDFYRDTYILAAAGGDTTIVSQLNAALGFTVWWKNPTVWVGVGVAALVIGVVGILT